ncbi:hypothetical protein K466DRAFT_281899 [Polyporus arcularius HHB13444]|uniref:Uncharacterized protein n=1 Tax=Polyporus arcularius HHB13444 TaxID=1314778 RepID=A0A5C3NZZ3_9APHY|nr:hypothetical protein K466DRAFT_281899 [Polyporus arcularius HHB13444]
MAVVRISRITGNTKPLSSVFLVCMKLRNQLLDKIGQQDGLSSDDVMCVMEGKVALSRRCNAHDLLRDWTRNSPYTCLDDCRQRLRKLLLAPFFVDFADASAREALGSQAQEREALQILSNEIPPGSCMALPADMGLLAGRVRLGSSGSTTPHPSSE